MLDFVYLITHPGYVISKFKWNIIKKKLKYCGKNVHVGMNCDFYGEHNICIENDVSIGNNVCINSFSYYNNENTGYIPNLIIKDNVTITSNTFISCLNKIVIGEGSLIGINSYISDNSHGNLSYEELEIPPYKRKLFSKGPVLIGKNVWIGRNVCVLPNVMIGDYSIIGANSVVTHDIPPYSIAAGAPAKVIKTIKNA